MALMQPQSSSEDQISPYLPGDGASLPRGARAPMLLGPVPPSNRTRTRGNARRHRMHYKRSHTMARSKALHKRVRSSHSALRATGLAQGSASRWVRPGHAGVASVMGLPTDELLQGLGDCLLCQLQHLRYGLLAQIAGLGDPRGQRGLDQKTGAAPGWRRQCTASNTTEKEGLP